MRVYDWLRVVPGDKFSSRLHGIKKNLKDRKKPTIFQQLFRFVSNQTYLNTAEMCSTLSRTSSLHVKVLELKVAADHCTGVFTANVQPLISHNTFCSFNTFSTGTVSCQKQVN